MNRRTFLLGTAATVLAGCGAGANDPKIDIQRKQLARRSVAIDYASYYAPIEDVRRLVNERAAAVGAVITFSDDAAGTQAQVANLKRWTGPNGGFRAIAIAPFDVIAADDAISGVTGVAIIAYVTELPRQTAAITVDRAEAGRRLAEDASKHGKGGVLLVRPLAKPAVPDPFAPGFADAEKAIREVLDVRATVEAAAQADAAAVVAATLAADASLTTVLCWNDTTALGAAEAVDRHGYVGGLGAPSLSAAPKFEGALKCLVAARLSELSNALVDVPLAYARGQKPGSLAVPVSVIKPRSAEAKAFAEDFRS